jgi:hypothetical protein
MVKIFGGPLRRSGSCNRRAADYLLFTEFEAPIGHKVS